jgi:hypothetical protein
MRIKSNENLMLSGRIVEALKKAEAACKVEVRNFNKLRKQKFWAKKRAQEIQDGTHISQKKVRALLLFVSA